MHARKNIQREPMRYLMADVSGKCIFIFPYIPHLQTDVLNAKIDLTSNLERGAAGGKHIVC